MQAQAPNQLPAAPPEPLAGLVERVTFHSDESGFCVLRIKARGHRELVTVVGTLPEVRAVSGGLGRRPSSNRPLSTPV